MSLNEKLKAQARTYPIEYSAAAMLRKPLGPDGAIVIGTLGTPSLFGWFSRGRALRAAQARAVEFGFTPPTKEEFFATFEGSVYLSVWNIPFVAHQGNVAQLLKGQSKLYNFSGLLASNIIGPATGDLVWARTTDHGFLIIQGVLCPISNADYLQCERQFDRGYFDLVTGLPITRSATPSTDGGIDPTTLKRRAGPRPEPARGGIASH